MTELLKENINNHISLTDDEMKAFCSLFENRIIKKKTLLLREGEVCKFEGFVTKGIFRVYHIDKSGAEHILYFAIENWWITDIDSFTAEKPSQLFIEALEDCELFTLSYADMQALYTHSQRFEKFGRIIAERLFIASAKSKRNLMVQSAEDRYIELLTNQPKIFERLPQHLIASYLGIQPQSLSRIRARLSNPKLT